MSATTPTWRTNLYAIVPHRSEPRILLLPGDGGWSLPCAHIDQRIWAPQVDRVSRALRDTLGIDYVVLRSVYVTVDHEMKQQMDAVYALEQRFSAWTPPAGARWVGLETLSDLPLAMPEQRRALLPYLHEQAGGPISPLRPPWARPGWFAAAESWTSAQLERLGYALVAPIEQIKNWGISCILRARTTAGDVYFKVAAPLPLFANEPLLMESLAAAHPDFIPAPLAIEHEQRWMLLADVGPELRDNRAEADWTTALRLYARIQRSFVGETEALLAMGCLDRSLDRLAAQIDEVLEDTAALERLSAAELTQIRSLAPRLRSMCGELAGYGVPQTLVHGDLHGGNIALRDERYLFFDWTDGCVAHPFLDVVTMMDEVAASLDAQACLRLRDAYLSLWTGYAPLEGLQAAWTIAAPLGALHQAVSYYHIVKQLEPSAKPELAWGVSYWLQQMLRSMPA
ncbi:MAG TPA: phosphotransferase [Herpetosiphonaceae bacterium]